MAATQPVDEEGLRLELPGRTLPAGAGWDWIARGWPLFTAAPLMWIIAIVIVVVVAVAVNLVPLLGGLVFQLLQAAIAAGFMVACRSLERGDDFEIEHLFAGFTRHFGSLLVVGAVMLAGWLGILLVFFVFAGFGVLGAMFSGDPSMALHAFAASMGLLLLGGLVATALMVPLLMAYWFAPALVVMHGMAPIAAMKASFAACLRNILPFLVYGAILFVFGIVAMIPLGLGFLVWWPVAVASTYIAYRQIFTSDEPPTAPLAPRPALLP